MGKKSVSTENRSLQLKYYYNTSRSKRLEKVKCKCGKITSRGNYNQHLYSGVHQKFIHKLLKEEKNKQKVAGIGKTNILHLGIISKASSISLCSP